MDALNRCSIAIRLPAELRAMVVETQLGLRRRAGADAVRWTPEPELMVTLVVLGELGPLQVEQARQATREAACQSRPLQIQLEGVGGHPTILQPRWLYINVGGDLAGLDALVQGLEHRLTPLLSDHEARQTRALVPIGRLKQESEQIRSALGRAVRMAQVGALGEFTATQVDFIRNIASVSGPIHETLEAVSLG